MLEGLTYQVDDYCERIDFSFWSEPVNAVTNFAIMFSAILALALYHKEFPLHGRKHRPNVLILIGLVMLIGVGSFLFHTTATKWAEVADVAPILVFIYVYHAVFLRRVLAWKYLYVVLYMIGFFGTGIVVASIWGRETLNGSIGYFPTITSFLFVWGMMLYLKRPGTRRFGLAALIFFFSLTFRTIDMYVCPKFPMGTHFMWHLLNAWVLYILLSLVIHLPNFYERKRDNKALQLGR
jgi:hypothetical protein